MVRTFTGGLSRVTTAIRSSILVLINCKSVMVMNAPLDRNLKFRSAYCPETSVSGLRYIQKIRCRFFFQKNGHLPSCEAGAPAKNAHHVLYRDFPKPKEPGQDRFHQHT